jgi:hypothetical protein
MLATFVFLFREVSLFWVHPLDKVTIRPDALRAAEEIG